MNDQQRAGDRTAERPGVDPASFGDGFHGVGPRPRWTSVYRWADVAGPPTDGVAPVPPVVCHRARGPITVDGSLDDPAWADATWTDDFGGIVDGSAGGHGVRMALLWDEEALYAAYRVRDPDVRAASVVHHDQVYMTDDDVELFIDGGERYYELGINPINTIYEFRWTWVEPLVERRDHAAIESLFKLPDFLYIVARRGERSGRVGDMGWELPGLRHAVRVQGSVNFPGDIDEGWTVEMALPWSGLREVLGARTLPPRPGDTIRMQAFRAQHDRRASARDAALEAAWPGATPADWFTWAPMGNTNVHNPERWVPVRFED